MMKKSQRKRLFVDQKVQGAILLRIVTYWFCCLLFITLPLFIALGYFRPHQPLAEQIGDVWSHCGPILTAAVLLLPLAVYDCLKLTNRFAGPLLRFRRELRRLAAGEEVPPLQFRGNDFWQDLAVPFNQIADQLRAARQPAARRAPEPGTPKGGPERAVPVAAARAGPNAADQTV